MARKRRPERQPSKRGHYRNSRKNQDTRTRDMFDATRATARPDGWTPHQPPELRGETLIRLDFETTGLKWWDGDKPVGLAYSLPQSGRRGYLAFGHEGGGNIPEDQVKTWARSLRGMHLDNANTRFDLHMGRAWGVDFTELDMTFGDVQHRAALLDDNRQRFGIDQLASEFLEDTGKYDLELRDKGELWRLPAWDVEPYAIQDVVLVDQLCDVMDPMIAAEDLGEVHRLEQAIIPVVVEMEKNGVYVNVERLHEWERAATTEFNQLLFDIGRRTGVKIESPDSPKALEAVFKARGVPITTFTDAGRPSFTTDVLQRAATGDAVIADLLRAGQLADLLSKYLTKYRLTVRSDGWMRFNLHQLRSGRDDHDKYGTVSGRFSSAGDKFGGFNVQQVVSPKKQKTKNWCTNYVIRNLFLPGSPDERKANPDLQWLAVDADQIEYRIFAHFASAPAILDAYQSVPDMTDEAMREAKVGPYTDYHDKVQDILRRAKPNIQRKHTKITNFCKLFGAGIPKFAWTLEMISDQQFKELNDRYAPGRWSSARRGERMRAMRAEPCLQEALDVYDTYDTQFPDAVTTLRLASDTARERGYVKTALGRRARFPGKQRLHSALNRAVQGTAADINKRVMVELYTHRRELALTMRMTVHDENDFDMHDPSKMPRIEELFNTQYVPLKVPILWTAETGPSWGEAKGKA